MSQTFLLLSGPLAVGKTTLRDLLVERHGFQIVRSSNFLRSKAEQEAGGNGRFDLQELGDRLDRETDFRWLLDEVAKPLLVAAPEQKRWLVDAVRKRRQVEHFRDAFGINVLHVHLVAPEQVLKERYEARAKQQGAFYDGCYEKAVDHDNEKQSRSLVSLADLVIDTNANDSAKVLADVVAAIAPQFT
jgi:dephospho-CoA kinase